MCVVYMLKKKRDNIIQMRWKTYIFYGLKHVFNECFCIVVFTGRKKKKITVTKVPIKHEKYNSQLPYYNVAKQEKKKSNSPIKLIKSVAL